MPDMKKEFSFIHNIVARRIFMLFIICAFLPVCALSVISLMEVSSTIKAERLEQLRHAGKNAGMTIVEVLDLFEMELRNIALTVTDASVRDSMELRTDGASGNDKRFKAFTIVSTKGGPRTLAGKPWPGPILTPGNLRHLTDGNALLFMDFAKEGSRLFMAVPMKRRQAKGDLLIGQINTDYLWTFVNHTVPQGTELCIIDSEGRTLFNSSPSEPRFISRILTELGVSSTGNLEWRNKGDRFLVNYWTVFLPPQYHTNSWTVIVSRNRDDAFQTLQLFGRTFMLVMALSMLVVVCLSSIQIRRSMIPLSTLRRGAQQLSEGNLATRFKLDSGDEFEELAETFNIMANHLQVQFSALEETGRISEVIFSAHDQASIFRAALSSRGTAVSCRAMSISLTDPHDTHTAVTYLGNTSGYDPDKKPIIFTDEEIQLLEENPRCLHVTDTGKFHSLLAHLKEEGSRFFYLFPFSIGGRQAGTLTIGYEQVPQRIGEDLTRVRKIADEVAAAMNNLRLLEELNQLNLGTIRALANAVDAKSHWTAGHSERVTNLALVISVSMGMKEAERELLYMGGLLHDIGKIAVPEAILNKEGALTDTEYALIKNHTVAGARILEPIHAYGKILPIVAQHHEWFDGTGYPLGLAGEEISLGSRILAVADVYDALVSERPYRAGLEKSRVLESIQEKSGQQFDPTVVEILLTVIEKPLPDFASVCAEFHVGDMEKFQYETYVS